MTFELIDLEELGEKALRDFHESLVQSDEGKRTDFQQVVSTLVGKVEFAYGVAAKLAHREQTIEGTAAIWAKMVAICDGIAAEVKRLEDHHPQYKASYDRILDYRNEAEKRRALHA